MWIDKYKEQLSISGRFPTMAKALELFEKMDFDCMVETGTIRLKDDWGAGMSTLVFGDFAKSHNRRLYTCDIDPKNIELCKEITKDFEKHIAYRVSDSVTFLKDFDEMIDFLYLDSMDCPEHDDMDSPALMASQMHQFNELKAAWDKLRTGSLILLDDNDFVNGGKTRMTKLELKRLGATEIMGGKQSLWEK